MIGGARAVLLGWGNSKPSQLVAYERLYKAHGMTTSSVIPNTLEGLGRPGADARSLAPLAAELAEEAGARPILVHLFSDNGFIGWAALLRALDASAGGRRAIGAVRAVLSDSSPGLWAVRGPLDFARRFSFAMTPAVARLMKRDVRERMPIVTPLLTLGFLGYQLVFRRSVRVMLSASNGVSERQPRCPHVYVYGEQDVLVPARDVRAWMARQREAGIEVEEHCFETARHVALYPNDPKRYRVIVNETARRVITA